jgi:hypothetical protein
MALRLVESCNGSAQCDYVIDYINESAGRR